MEEKSSRYYCYDSIKKEDNEKWQYLLDYAFQKADTVEFNILYSYDLITEIEGLKVSLLETGKRENKLYPGNYVRFRLSDPVKHFIRSKNYSDWYNFNLEDISFLQNGKEFFATITHQDYIILDLTEKQRKELNEMGFDFWCEWIID
jgi:hypothetical protein